MNTSDKNKDWLLFLPQGVGMIISVILWVLRGCGINDNITIGWIIFPSVVYPVFIMTITCMMLPFLVCIKAKEYRK